MHNKPRHSPAGGEGKRGNHKRDAGTLPPARERNTTTRTRARHCPRSTDGPVPPGHPVPSRIRACNQERQEKPGTGTPVPPARERYRQHPLMISPEIPEKKPGQLFTTGRRNRGGKVGSACRLPAALGDIRSPFYPLLFHPLWKFQNRLGSGCRLISSTSRFN